MIIRIVKLTFKPEHIQDFKNVFDVNETRIAAFPGCLSVSLLQDQSNNNIFFTYSYWKDEEALEQYRNSDLFLQVWGTVKMFFDDRPMAWSCRKLN
jgi:quinol monooxygenase YgiN